MDQVTARGGRAAFLSGASVALAVLLLEVGMARAADEIHWTVTGPTSVSFGWRGCESFVRYGTTPAYGRVAGGVAPTPTPQSSPGPFWEARITGLRENTRYHYSIGNGPDHTFQTPPAKGASGFTAFVAGDIGDSTHYWRVADLQDMIATAAPDFVLMVGDLTYGNDKGQDAVDRHFNDVMKWSQDAAYMPAWGNHEWDSAPADDLRNYKGRFDLPHPQTSPGVPPESCCGEDWSWFDYGNVRFIAYPEPYSPATWPDWHARAQVLMDEAQADPAIRFIVTFGHRPAYSSGNHPGSPALADYMGQLGVAHDKYVLDLCGHSHNYERSHPQDGVVHITAGTGGSDLAQHNGACLWEGGCPPPAWSAFRAMHHVAVRLEFTASAIEGTVFCGPPGGTISNINDISCAPGEIVDTFTIGAAAAADTFFVDGASAACGDAGPGTESQPYCTIGAALGAHAAPGSVVVVRPATYREQVTITASGAPANPIILHADPGAVLECAEDLSLPGSWVPVGGEVWLAPVVGLPPKQVLVDSVPATPGGGGPLALLPGEYLWTAGEGLYLNVGGDNPGLHQVFAGLRNCGFVLSGVSWVTVEGFDVRHADDRAFQVQAGSSHVTLRGNSASFSGRFGINVSGGSDILIEDNRVSHNGDHGIHLTQGVTASTLVGNESYGNARTGSSGANGIHLYGSPGNVITRNRLHDNQDTGLQIQSGSNDCRASLNRSWNNGDHGFDQLSATGVTHVGDVAWGNRRCGFIVQGGSTGNQISNCIAADNGLGLTQFNLAVDAVSTTGFVSDANLFWNSNGQPGFKYGTLVGVTLAQYRAASGLDPVSVEADPRFVNPAGGDFHLGYDSPAIDNGDSGVQGWPALDAEGFERADDPAIGNSGSGPVTYGDRGALEYRPDPPNAVLAATPTSGTAPLQVTFDAGASSAAAGPIASYDFDSGDGMYLLSRPSPTFTHVYSAGRWMASAVVTDSVGRVSRVTVPIVVAPAIGPNLVTNSSFEANTSGWLAYSGASVARVPGGLEGGWALQVNGPSGAALFGINDSPNAVTSTVAGTRYRLGAWVCAPQPAGAVELRVQESVGGTAVGPRLASQRVTLSCLWQAVTMDYVAQTTGGTLDLQVIDIPGAERESFRVDRITAQVATDATTAVPGDSTAARPLAPVLAPNPVTGRGVLRFATFRRGPLRVELFDLGGRRVRTLLNQADAAPGERAIAIGGEEMAGGRLGAGLYFYRIRAAEGMVTRKFMLLR